MMTSPMLTVTAMLPPYVVRVNTSRSRNGLLVIR
jgi:hypothetical protein